MIKVRGVKLTDTLEGSVAPARYRRGNQRSGCQTESFLLFEKIIPGRLMGEERRGAGGGGGIVKPVDETQPNWGRWGEGRAARGKVKIRQEGGDEIFFWFLLCGGHLFLCRSSYCNTGCLRLRTRLEKMMRCSICCVCSHLLRWNKWF